MEVRSHGYLISSRTNKYKIILYCINTLVLFIAIALVIFGIWASISSDSIIMKSSTQWIITTNIVSGILIAIICTLGIVGARKADELITNQKCNYYLLCYFVCITIFFVLQLIAGAFLLAFYSIVDDTKSSEQTKETKEFESKVKEFLISHPREWIRIQNALDCCGYENNTAAPVPPETGTACAEPESKFCKDKILAQAKDQLLGIGIFSLIVGLIEIIALIATLCLCCCVTNKDRYHRMEDSSYPSYS